MALAKLISVGTLLLHLGESVCVCMCVCVCVCVRSCMHAAKGHHLYWGGKVTVVRRENDLGGAAKTLELNLVLMYDNQGTLLKGIK